MKREIEALLAAYLADRNKEAQVVQELLTALAVGAAGRQRMLHELAVAVGATAEVAPVVDRPPSRESIADISTAITLLRAARVNQGNLVS